MVYSRSHQCCQFDRFRMRKYNMKILKIFIQFLLGDIFEIIFFYTIVFICGKRKFPVSYDNDKRDNLRTIEKIFNILVNGTLVRNVTRCKKRVTVGKI